MLCRFSKLLVVLALAGSIGLHWAFLQVVAWTGMVITYAQDRPVTEAVSDTFDGQHPCSLCKQIAKEQRGPAKAEFKVEQSKLKFLYRPPAIVFSARPVLWELAAPNESAELLTHAPPVPPPRVFFS